MLLMLAAGVITCIITFVQQFSSLNKLIALFCVMLLFYVLGSVLKWTLDFFDAQNEKRRKEEGEVIEKEAEDQEGTQEPGEDQEPGDDQEPDAQ